MTSNGVPDALAVFVRRPDVVRLLEALDGNGEETRVVGGAVRSALLGEPVGDIDLATTAVPEEVMRRALAAGFKPVPTGIEHGTVTVVVDGVPFEVTTLREDIATDGRRARVRFGRDFARDAQRRDLTINALFLGRDGRLHDPVGGLADLKARRIRFIGDARQRIREDYLRILRLFRFHAQLGAGEIDRDAIAAAMAERQGLRRLSRERIRTEFLKLLVAPGAAASVATMTELGFLDFVTGGVAEHGRLARAIDAEAARGSPPDTMTRLAALSVFLVEDAERLREGLRLSNAEHARLAAIAKLMTVLHGERAPLDRSAIRRLAVEHGLQAVRDALAIVDGEPRPCMSLDARATLAALVAGREKVPIFRLSGANVTARGIKAGPRVGAVLERAKALWLAADCPADRTVLDGLLDQAIAADSR